MMDADDEIRTAVDVIRSVYLARVAAKRGDRQSARRWQAKADAWLEQTRVAWCNGAWGTSTITPEH